jgi:hypothetical protein
MDNRKVYVAPCIAWEDELEQTSLACNASAIVLDTVPTCDAQANQKGGLWWAEQGFCNSPVLNGQPACFPSEIGVVLS